MTTTLTNLIAGKRVRRVASFLITAAILGVITEGHDALTRGEFSVPAAWAPFVPLGVTLASLLIAALTPQVLELRRSAFGPANAPSGPSAAEIAEAVAGSILQAAPTIVATLSAAAATPPAPSPAEQPLHAAP